MWPTKFEKFPKIYPSHERDKSVKLEPCGHLLCNTCLDQWQKQNNDDNSVHKKLACPFCREDVRSKITIKFSSQNEANNSPNKNLLSSSRINSTNSSPRAPKFRAPDPVGYEEMSANG